jgi:acetyl esterase/lipase
MLAAGGTGPAAALTPAGVRKTMSELALALDPRDLAPVRTEDLMLPGPGGPLALRCYEAQTLAPAPSAGLVYFHGGIGVFGSLQTHDAVCRMLALDGALRVLAVDYRLAPEHPYPAALEDACFATAWIAGHAARLRLRPQSLAIGGDSAGATLATVVCRRARDAGGPALAAQLLLCPVTDLCARTASRDQYADGYFLSRALLDWAVDLYCPAGIDRRDADLSPLRAPDLAGLPAAHVHTAEFDPMRDEGADYARALAQAGVAVDYTCHAGLIHHYYGMAGAIPAARIALRQAAQALGRALAGAPPA